MPDARLCVSEASAQPFRYDEDDAKLPHALMAIRLPKPTKRVSITEDDQMSVSSMAASEWTITDPEAPIPGGDKIFTDGKFKGMTYTEVTAKHPQNYVALKKSKSLPIAQRAYVNWVSAHHHVNENTKLIVPKVDYGNVPGSQGRPNPGNCQHENVHHQGSSARYRRTTCKDCKEVWQEEREKGTKDPEHCRHLHTDHRGSTELIRKTFCNTHIDCQIKGAR